MTYPTASAYIYQIYVFQVWIHVGPRGQGQECVHQLNVYSCAKVTCGTPCPPPPLPKYLGSGAPK